MQTITDDIVIAGFRLVERVGIGSAGEVWRATDDQQVVAVKFLNTALLERSDRIDHLKRFRTEALALKHVSDLPHIPAHIHHDLKTERPYIVMEFINSTAFSDLLISSEMMYVPLPHRLHALNQVAKTLSIVHQRGIIHRDIKPSNIHGINHPYLLDFSIGIPIQHSAKADRTVGTPLYLTPDLLPPTARTDGYAFAIVVYEILFGRHPIFDYRNVPDNTDELRQQASNAILNETWCKPNQLLENDLPLNLKGADLDQLTTIFQNALMLSEDRYADVAVFMEDVLDAIYVDGNQPYIDAIPLPTDEIGRNQAIYHENFTDQLVAIHTTNTNLPDEYVETTLNTRRWIIGLSVLFAVLFILVVMLIFLPPNPPS